jgi:hypothetical protein
MCTIDINCNKDIDVTQVPPTTDQDSAGGENFDRRRRDGI